MTKIDSSFSIPNHPRLKFSEAGLRGVVGETLLPPLVAAITGAFAGILPPGPVALGRDTRLSGPVILDLVAASLLAAGRDVIDLGICPVPTIEYFVRTEGIAGAIDVTASHNPAEWNALKFIGPDGFFLDREAAARLAEAARTGVDWASYDRMGARRIETSAVERHIARILEVVDADLIRARRFKVAFDCVNGAASIMTPLLLARLGCDLVPLYCETDKLFPHPPEPRPKNLGDLIRAVAESGADIGFAQDPDADRLALVAEKGRPLSEEYTLVLATEHVLSHKPGRAAVGNLSGSRMLEDTAARHGSPCFRTEIGEINVSKKLREVGGAIGGEGNGGVMLPEVHECRDSFTGIALILEMMAERRATVSALVDAMPSYAMEKFQCEVPPALIAPTVAAVKERMASGAGIDERDGVKLSWADRWIHVRGSNTEPIIRIMAEAPTEAEAQALIDAARGLMPA
jgi:phosphomannomutase